MSDRIALRLESLNRELAASKEGYVKLKGRTTHNLHKGLEFKRDQIRIETEMAKLRTEYLTWLADCKRMSRRRDD